MESRPIYKKIDKYERAGGKNGLEPVWKGHWEELRLDIITARTPALLFGALLEVTTAISNYGSWRHNMWSSHLGGLSPFVLR